MAVSSLLSLPVTIRERIYAELLTYPSTTPITEGRAPSSALCSLLFVNHQFKGEILTFLESQLCVLIKTNDPKFVNDILKDRNELLLISQLHSKDSTVQKEATTASVGMELDLYMYHNHLDAVSFPAFLVPAKSIKQLLRVLWSPSWVIWTMQASVSLALLETFSHTQEAALNKLVQPWIDWFCPQHFVGFSTNPAISRELSSQLKQKLLGDYAATGHLRKIQSLTRGGFDRAQVQDWTGAAERFRMAMRYIKIVWDCHLECLKQGSRGVVGDRIDEDFVTHLWLMTSDAAANHVQVLINAALNLERGVQHLSVPTISGNKGKFEEARGLAEATIRFLNARSPRVSDGTADDEDARKAVRKAKAKMSFRTHLTCKGLGDTSAAIGYLEEARKHEPETAVTLNGKINALRAEERNTDDKKRPAIRWEGRV